MMILHINPPRRVVAVQAFDIQKLTTLVGKCLSLLQTPNGSYDLGCLERILIGLAPVPVRLPSIYTPGLVFRQIRSHLPRTAAENTIHSFVKGTRLQEQRSNYTSQCNIFGDPTLERESPQFSRSRSTSAHTILPRSIRFLSIIGENIKFITKVVVSIRSLCIIIKV